MSAGWKVLYVGKGRLDGTYGTLMFAKSLSEPVTREHAEMAVAADVVQFQIVPPDAYLGEDVFLARPPAWRIKTTAPGLQGLIKDLPVFVSEILIKAVGEREKAKARTATEDPSEIKTLPGIGPAPAQEPAPARPAPVPPAPTQHAPAQRPDPALALPEIRPAPVKRPPKNRPGA